MKNNKLFTIKVTLKNYNVKVKVTEVKGITTTVKADTEKTFYGIDAATKYANNIIVDIMKETSLLSVNRLELRNWTPDIVNLLKGQVIDNEIKIEKDGTIVWVHINIFEER